MERDKQKNNFLISIGLFEKVYSDKEEWSSDYPYTDDNNKYYKKVALDVTNDEYIKILELSNQKDVKVNKIMIMLIVIGWVTYGIGFFAGLIVGGTGYEFSYSMAFKYWISSFISGTLFLSFAEIIRLLHKISLK